MNPVMQKELVAEPLGPFPLWIVEGIGNQESNVQTALTGYDIQVVPSHRSKSRVWRVVHGETGNTWYVKRVPNRQILGRYVEALDRLGYEAGRSQALIVPKLVCTDSERLLVVTTAVEGVSAHEYFVKGARFDKIPWWPGSNLVGLADVLCAGLTALRTFACDMHPDLQDYSPAATADRMRLKLQRLSEVVPELHARVAPGVERALATLQTIERPCSLLLGDLDLSHLVIVNGRLGVVDLDGIGAGDWKRDVACLLDPLEYRGANWKYSRYRVERFQLAILGGLGVERHDPLIALYRVEFCLDYLWASVHTNPASELPIHDRSIHFLEKQLRRQLDRLI